MHNMEYKHIPVALQRTLELLTPILGRNEKTLFIDTTLGLGGHTQSILENFPNTIVIGFDRDSSAIKIAEMRLAKFSDRVFLVNQEFDQIAISLEKLFSEGKIPTTFISGALFDLGVSSMQLDKAERGFSYNNSGPLDMRMDQRSEVSAEIVVNTYSKSELIKILTKYGEEKFASKIAENIVNFREKTAIKTTDQLAQIVKDSIPAPARRQGGNPAKRTFQAIRIEVNQELNLIEKAVPQALNLLAVGGRLIILSYQSLEDKIVKEIFQEYTEVSDLRGLPVALPNSAAKYKLLTRGSELASQSEIELNPRAASLRLRAIERLAA